MTINLPDHPMSGHSTILTTNNCTTWFVLFFTHLYRFQVIDCDVIFRLPLLMIVYVWLFWSVVFSLKEPRRTHTHKSAITQLVIF